MVKHPNHSRRGTRHMSLPWISYSDFRLDVPVFILHTFDHRHEVDHSLACRVCGLKLSTCRETGTHRRPCAVDSVAKREIVLELTHPTAGHTLRASSANSSSKLWRSIVELSPGICVLILTNLILRWHGDPDIPKCQVSITFLPSGCHSRA